MLEKVTRDEQERAEWEKAKIQLADTREVRGSSSQEPRDVQQRQVQAVGALPNPASRCSGLRGRWGQLPY